MTEVPILRNHKHFNVVANTFFPRKYTDPKDVAHAAALRFKRKSDAIFRTLILAEVRKV